jgi:hypothetical protein
MSSRELRSNGPLSQSIRDLQDSARRGEVKRSYGTQVDSHPLGSNVRASAAKSTVRQQQTSGIPRFV